MPALTCCIIAKNEAPRIPLLLKGLSTICEQTVLIDTGSTDNTAQVARALGADVHFFRWNDSFSDARNKSLEMADNPWILCVDADDNLPERSLIEIAKLRKQPPDKAFGFVIRSTQDGVTGMASTQIRMFPNRKGLRFRYRVHEQIRPALIEHGIPIIFTEVEIIHTGYMDKDTIADKQQRNLKLLEKDLADHPADGFLHYLAGMAWMDLGEMERATNELQSAWALAVADPDKRHIALGAALELTEMASKGGHGAYEGALLWLERAEGMKKEYPRCLYLRGFMDYNKDDLENALKSLTQMMECEKPDLLLPIDLTILKSMGAALMGQIYMKMGRPQDAVLILDRAQQALKKRF